MKNYKFRPYRHEDVSQCAKMAIDVWPIVSKIAFVKNLDLFMKAYIEMSQLSSDYTRVCYDNQHVIGLLFGSTGRKKLTQQEKKIKRALLWRFITCQHGNFIYLIRFVIADAISEMKVAKSCRKLDSEVVLLLVDKNHQHHGIGRRLLSDFLEHVRKKKHKTVYLYTDVESNWKFYEKYGFIKLRDFNDNGLSVLTKKRVKSFIYYYKL